MAVGHQAGNGKARGCFDGVFHLQAARQISGEGSAGVDDLPKLVRALAQGFAQTGEQAGAHVVAAHIKKTQTVGRGLQHALNFRHHDG
ncbi:MAG: DUF2125 domain-containing protein [Deltaproteobacteria bacterium]|nr:DUF2125 domain-containing protein [Deltaproteobacteria bacterium]